MKIIINTIMLLLIVLHLGAQTDSTDKIINVNEVVIAANKFAELRSNTAQQTQIISSSDLQRNNAQNTADALSLNGQVFVQKSQQGGGSAILRGLKPAAC